MLFSIIVTWVLIAIPTAFILSAIIGQLSEVKTATIIEFPQRSSKDFANIS